MAVTYQILKVSRARRQVGLGEIAQQSAVASYFARKVHVAEAVEVQQAALGPDRDLRRHDLGPAWANVMVTGTSFPRSVTPTLQMS